MQAGRHALAPAPAVDGGASPRPIRVLIVDDSAVARAVLARMIEDQGGFEIRDAVPSAAEALKALERHHVDIILLDIMMPERTGLCALPELIEAGRGAKVLIVSAMADHGAEETVRALALGAADTLAKPGKGNFGGRFAAVLAEKMWRLIHAPAAAPADHRPLVASSDVRSAMAVRGLNDQPVECVAIGASTGGLHALSSMLRAMRFVPQVPILVTQHLPPIFMPYFARQLTEFSGAPAAVAEDGARVMPGVMLVAPGTAHLAIERRGRHVHVRLSDAPAPSRCVPSVDPMLESAAAVYGPGTMGVMLSGMGRDGAQGAASLVSAGGQMIVQDLPSCVVWGMPGAVAQAGLAAAILDPAGIAEVLTGRIGPRP